MITLDGAVFDLAEKLAYLEKIFIRLHRCNVTQVLEFVQIKLLISQVWQNHVSCIILLIFMQLPIDCQIVCSFHIKTEVYHVYFYEPDLPVYFSPRPVLTFRYCDCLHLCMCVHLCVPNMSTQNLNTCSRTAKFGQKMQNTLVKIPINFWVDWTWHSRSKFHNAWFVHQSIYTASRVNT